MFNKSKILKKENEKVTELDEDIGKSLTQLEQKGEVSLRGVFITSTDMVQYKAADGIENSYILVRIPFRSLQNYKKVSGQVIDHLEQQFKWPVLIVANRTIISKRAKMHPSQMRPRSRTLKAVHASVLTDVCTPSTVVGRRNRCTIDGKLHERVFLDPLDKEMMEAKIDALAHAY
jgi:small subunit ribosomal protein S7e